MRSETAKDSKTGLTINYKSITFTSCATFRPQDRPESTRIHGLKQPRSTKPTSSIRVYIKDSAGPNGNIIAYMDSGATFTPTAGPLTVVAATLAPTTVSALTSFTWSIRPAHGLDLSGGALGKPIKPD